MKNSINFLKVALLAGFMALAILPSGAMADITITCDDNPDNCEIQISGPIFWHGTLTNIEFD